MAKDIFLKYILLMLIIGIIFVSGCTETFRETKDITVTSFKCSDLKYGS